MRSKYLLMLKVEILRFCNPAFFRGNQNAAKRRRMAGMAAGMLLIAGVMMAYSGMAAYGMAQIGAVDAVPGMMLGVSCLMIFVFTFLKSDGAMFAGRDFDQVMSLPVTGFQAASVKFTFLYLMGLGVCLLFLVPPLAVYGVFTNAGPGNILWMVCMVLTAPLIPVVLALVLGTLILTLTSRLPFRQFFVFLISAVMLVLVLGWTGTLNAENTEQLEEFGLFIAEMSKKLYPPSGWACAPLMGNGFGGAAGYLGLSVFVTVVFLGTVGAYYIRINSILASMKRTRVKTAKTGKRSTVFLAIYRKELRRLFTCSIYAMNTLTGLILMVAFGVMVLVMPPEKMGETLGMPGIMERVQGICPIILALLAGMTSTTAPSLSLEGKCRWILCSLPVSPIQIFRAKIAVYVSLALPCALISGICIRLKFPLSGTQTILLFLMPAAYSFFSAVFGMLVNVRFPSYDWNHERQAVKNSVSVLVSMLGGMFMGIVPLALAMALPGYGIPICFTATSAALVISAVCYVLLCRVRLYE